MLVERWRQEYARKGIPSSYRTDPSGSVLSFHEFLRRHSIPTGRILDLGCGKGRNALYLARQGFEVHCIDFVPHLTSSIRRTAAKHHLPLSPRCQSVTDPLPYPDQHFDAVIDTFCYKHQTDKGKQAIYRREVFRILKDRGFYLLSLASPADGYYGPLLERSPDPGNRMITDPVTGIPSLLYSRADVEREFAPHFIPVQVEHKRKPYRMHGKPRTASTLVFIMKKRTA